jgi:uncharacterized repeat protein (TIGR03806 family)
MKKLLLLSSIPALVALIVILQACKKDPVTIDTYDKEVAADLALVPYPKLSDYNFFHGEMKYQHPAPGVIPYEPISSLFTDYALKKRFIWMPEGVRATYNGDGKVLEMPVGTVLIKTFYYRNVLPTGKMKVLETRLMIRKESGWIFATYKWNDEQTEAFYTTSASVVAMDWLHEGKYRKSTNYRIPSQTECLICHKKNSSPHPIGIKPQSLNADYNYADGRKNMLRKLIEERYLENNLPGNIVTTVNYKDHTKSVELRLRSYLDINCAHCHAEGGHCDYRPMRLAFSETVDAKNIGLCVEPDEIVSPNHTHIISPNSPETSVMHLRLNTNQVNLRMPLIGRTMIHKESVALLEEWIRSKKTCE